MSGGSKIIFFQKRFPFDPSYSSVFIEEQRLHAFAQHRKTHFYSVRLVEQINVHGPFQANLIAQKKI